MITELSSMVNQMNHSSVLMLLAVFMAGVCVGFYYSRRTDRRAAPADPMDNYDWQQEAVEEGIVIDPLPVLKEQRETPAVNDLDLQNHLGHLLEAFQGVHNSFPEVVRHLQVFSRGNRYAGELLKFLNKHRKSVEYGITARELGWEHGKINRFRILNFHLQLHVERAIGMEVWRSRASVKRIITFGLNNPAYIPRRKPSLIVLMGYDDLTEMLMKVDNKSGAVEARHALRYFMDMKFPGVSRNKTMAIDYGLQVIDRNLAGNKNAALLALVSFNKHRNAMAKDVALAVMNGP